MIYILFYLHTAYLYCDDTKSIEVLQGCYVSVQITFHRNLTRSCIQLKHALASRCKQAIAVVKFPVLILLWGARIAQWLERRTRVRLPAGALREFSSPGSAFCADLFSYPFHTRITAVACKRSRSFCQKCRWRVTAKHACTLRLHEVTCYGAWLYGVHRTCRDDNSFTWHQPCNTQTAP